MAKQKTSFETELYQTVKNNDIDKARKLLNSSKIREAKLNDDRFFDYFLVMQALSKSRIPLAKLFIEKGFRVYKKSKVEKTILEHAVRLKDTDLITAVLAKGGSADILTCNRWDKTPLHVAIKTNQVLAIDLFLSYFNDVQILDENNFLHYAIGKLDTTVISKLVEKGLSMTKRNEENLSPFCLIFKMVGKKHQSKILDCLMSHFGVKNIKLDNVDDVAPSYLACIIGNLQVVKEYVHSGLSINTPLKWNTEPWPCLDKYSGFTLLHCAVKHLKLDILQFMLSIEADICIPNENGSTPLHIAFETKEKGIWETWEDFENNNSMIDLMLEATLKFKSNPVNKYGLSHFHIACSTDKYNVVEHFLKLAASINEPVSSECHRYKGFSPLHFAAKFRCAETLQLLLNNGADVNQRNFNKRTALHIAAKEPCLDVIHLLLQYDADINSKDSDDNTPVHLAFEKKNYEIIDLLLSVQNVSAVNTQGLSHFHIACTRNNVDIVKSYIENGTVINTCVPAQSEKKKKSYVSSWSGYSPLHFAVSHNRSKNVQLLLKSGADVGMKDSEGFTPLHLACQYNYTMFREFIENTLCDLKKNGEISLQQKSITDIIEVSEKWSNGFSGTIEKICWTSHRAEHLEIIKSLLNFKSEINCTDNNGNTPVIHACAAVKRLHCESDNNFHCSKALWNDISKNLSDELSERNESIIDNLLSVKVNLDKCYKNGSILHYMCSREDDWAVKMIKVFLEKGTDVNDTNDKMLSPLQQAVSIGNEKMIRTLLNFDANVNCIDPEDNSTLLMIAVCKVRSSSRCINIVKRLIDKGANVNAIHSDGRTVLHDIASKFYPGRSSELEKIISALVKAGANINSRDSKGCTPLHIACLEERHSMPQHLLMYGADINAEDNEGESVCCNLYKILIRNRSLHDDSLLASVLENHIIKMNAIGLSMSKKVLRFHVMMQEITPPTDQEKREWITKCEGEVRVLQDTKITSHSTLYDAIFKDENTLSMMVKNCTFKSTVKSTSFKQKFPVYGTLIQLKYQEGVDRGNLLQIATRLLNKIAGQQLPDACTEHICKYFTNFELKECTATLSSFLDSNAKTSDDNNTTARIGRANKRQKVC